MALTTQMVESQVYTKIARDHGHTGGAAELEAIGRQLVQAAGRQQVKAPLVPDDDDDIDLASELAALEKFGVGNEPTPTPAPAPTPKEPPPFQDGLQADGWWRERETTLRDPSWAIENQAARQAAIKEGRYEMVADFKGFDWVR